MTADADIRKILARSCQYLDDRRFRDWADLFTEDAVMGRMHGREDVYARISQAELAQKPELRRKHLIVNSVIDHQEDAADVVSDLLMIDLTEEGACNFRMGRYHDRLALVDGQWLFRERRLEWLDEA